MDVDVVRFMVRRKLVERRLPHERLTNVRFTPGAGQMCDACGANITPDHMATIGAPSAGGQTRPFHALCFCIWENERHLLDWLHEVADAERLLSRNQVAVKRSDRGLANMKCADCFQVLSPDDTFEVQGHHLVHSDCRKPRNLSREVRALLFKYCYEHVVATCPACSQEFRQYELASDLIRDRTHLCPRCRVDLTERLREHLYDCAMLPGEVRYRAREARAANQRLLKESQQAIDRSDVLMRETEATLAAHRALLREARAARDALRETLQGRKPH